MKKLKRFFEDIKKNMPRHTQWILLGIALVLTLMLILLLTDGKQNRAKKADDVNGGGVFSISVTPGAVDFGSVLAGESKEEKIKISANVPVIVSDIKLSSESAGLSTRNTCTTMGKITDKLPCEITLIWNPKGSVADGKNVVNIKYHDAAGSKDMEKLETVNVSFSAKDKEEEPEPAAEIIPDILSAPVKKEVPAEPLYEEEDEEEEEVIEELPPPEPIVKPEPVPREEKKTDAYVSAPEECYQFAFAGYNNGGKQIGWIKPDGGRYRFHPFSDKNCSKPTGEYNPNTGFITSLDNPSKKIGSDAEHIGGRGAGANLAMPTLSNQAPKKQINRAAQLDAPMEYAAGSKQVFFAPTPQSTQEPSSLAGGQATISSRPYDRTFVLRHFKPIPATIVNEVRAVAKENASMIPVMATVDRHVYSDNGRTIVVPAGTLMLGSVIGDMPGPYKTIGRINIEWYRFVRPDGVEFNFTTNDKPFSGDSQGRVGVPGYGSSDYLEQMVMPLLTAMVPAVTNLVAPISDRIVNQIDLDNNVVVQSGTMRSSELAKQEMIKSWNKVTEKLFIDMLDNTKPPFSIAAGTRITVYSPTDLIVAWCAGDKCTPTKPADDYAAAVRPDYTIGITDPASILGQVASYISGDESKIKDARLKQLMQGFQQYQSKSMAANDVYQNQLEKNKGIMKSDGAVLKQGTAEYNKEVLGMKSKTVTDDSGNESEIWLDPSKSHSAPSAPPPPDDAGLTCEDGTPPDADGCCTGETFTDMGDAGWNCCPDGGGDCFPPIQ
jgi:type IV secretory pathway VirB10-like protein